MRLPQSGLPIDNPAFPLLQGLTTYWGVTTGAGAATGTTVVDALCGTAGLEPSYVGQKVRLLSGDAAGQERDIAVHALATGTLTVASAFTDFNGAVYQVPGGTRFCIIPGGGGGAPGPPTPEVGLWMFGICDPAMVASTTDLLLTNLAGFPDDIFNDEFWIQVIHNDDAPGTAPEREIRRVTNYVGATGTFTTDAFTVNVEADDLVCVFHESIMGIEILGYGTLDTSSITVPADSTRAEGNDYFKGCLLMPTEGAVRMQPRPIRSFTTATGVFTLDEPFTAAPGLVDYIIIASSYPVQRLIDIFNLVNAMLVTTEAGGTLTTDGNVQDLYINNAPAGVYEPLTLLLDLTNVAAADTVQIRVLYRINPTGGFILKDEVDFTAVQALPLKNIALEPNRYGVQVTIQRTAGADHAYDWEVIYRV